MGQELCVKSTVSIWFMFSNAICAHKGAISKKVVLGASLTKTWGLLLEAWNNVLALSVWGILNFKCNVEKMDLWRWVESVKCWCLGGAALALCGWGGLSLSWALGSSGEPILLRSLPAPCTSELLQVPVTAGQQLYAEAGSPGASRVTQQCSVQCPLHFCSQVQKLILGRQPSMCSSGPCQSPWRKAEQPRLSEIWRCLHQGCAVWHREHHEQGRTGSSNALPAYCFQDPLLGLELSSTALTKCLPLPTTPSGSSSYLCPTCSSQREHFKILGVLVRSMITIILTPYLRCFIGDWSFQTESPPFLVSTHSFQTSET